MLKYIYYLKIGCNMTVNFGKNLGIFAITLFGTYSATGLSLCASIYSKLHTYKQDPSLGKSLEDVIVHSSLGTVIGGILSFKIGQIVMDRLYQN